MEPIISGPGLPVTVSRLGEYGNDALLRIRAFKTFQAAIDGDLKRQYLKPITNTRRQRNPERLEEADAAGFFQNRRRNTMLFSRVEDALVMVGAGKDGFFGEIQWGLTGQD